MLTENVAKKLQDDLHQIASDLGYDDVVFNITANIQKYESDMKNKDGDDYNPCVLKLNGTPFTFSSLDIEIYDYTLSIYGISRKRKKIEEIFVAYKKLNNIRKNIGNNQVYLYASNLLIDDFENTEDGRNKKRFNGRVDIEIQLLPYTIDGVSTSISFDNIVIPFNTIRFRKDKSLIPNIEFGGSNTSVKLISETMQLEIPAIAENSKIMELLSDTLNDNYNKKYLIKWEIGNIIKTVDMIFRVGTVEYNRNGQPITFWVTLERALTRKDFKVDGVTIPVLKWSFNGSAEITSISKSDGVKSKIIGNGRTVTALFLNDGSTKINDIIENVKNHSKFKRFNLVFNINDIVFDYQMIINNGSIQVTEHPDLMIECTFIEGVL